MTDLWKVKGEPHCSVFPDKEHGNVYILVANSDGDGGIVLDETKLHELITALQEARHIAFFGGDRYEVELAKVRAQAEAYAEKERAREEIPAYNHHMPEKPANKAKRMALEIMSDWIKNVIHSAPDLARTETDAEELQALLESWVCGNAEEWLGGNNG